MTEYCLNSSAEEQQYFENSNSKRNEFAERFTSFMDVRSLYFAIFPICFCRLLIIRAGLFEAGLR